MHLLDVQLAALSPTLNQIRQPRSDAESPLVLLFTS